MYLKRNNGEAIQPERHCRSARGLFLFYPDLKPLLLMASKAYYCWWLFSLNARWGQSKKYFYDPVSVHGHFFFGISALLLPVCYYYAERVHTSDARTHAAVWTCASTWGSIPSRPRSGERQLYSDAVAIGIIGLLETNWSTALLWVASLIN